MKVEEQSKIHTWIIKLLENIYIENSFYTTIFFLLNHNLLFRVSAHLNFLLLKWEKNLDYFSSFHGFYMMNFCQTKTKKAYLQKTTD